MILYQSEPFSTVARNRYQALFLPAVTLYNASEVWDYSMSNIQFYKRAGFPVKTRYVPPGASLLLDANASLKGCLRSESYMGFLGQRQPPAGLKVSPSNIKFAPQILHV